ncbi:MAG: hypothetical protein WC129_04870 [Sphaerochaetaceae bacterium]|jgi:hypothetical protein|nr:hypothetical protein [Sphaerochaetaceae bacterium]MDX9808913.1 hypothetical protein [Sphaerochaetaceae bacterium]NLV84628.1 hypothetical protein [Spirochaetales bacterium]
MIESTDMILHLYQDMPYRDMLDMLVDNTCSAAYDALLAHMDPMEALAEGCIHMLARPTDELVKRSVRAIWFRETPVDGSESWSIPKGSYWFRQLPFSPSNGKELEPIVASFANNCIDWSVSETPLYIRLFKERRFETVVQLFMPKV